MIKHAFVIFLISMVSLVHAQSKAIMDSMELAFQEAYTKRISKKYLDGTYIPKDILDACSELSRLSDPRGIEKIKMASEEDAVRKLHFGLGKWISHKWSFYDGSRYSHYLKELGIHMPDDMIRITIRMWHRQLLNKPLNFKQTIEKMVSERKKEWQEEQAKKLIYLGPKLH